MNTLANSFGSQTDFASYCDGKFLFFQLRKQLDRVVNSKNKQIATLLLFSVLTSAPAIAADQGFYGYIDYGLYMFSNSPKGGSMDGIGIGGGYRFNTYVGVEAGLSIIDIFQDKSSPCPNIFGTCPQESLSASSYQYSLVGTMPNGLFVKLGWANTSLDYSYSYTPCFLVFCDPTSTGSGSATKTNPMFGIGWQSDVNQHSYWRVQYENFGTNNMTINYNNQASTTSHIGIEAISIGLVYNF